MNKIRLILATVLAFLKRKPRVVVSYQIVPRDICRLTMEQWRATPDLCNSANKALHDPIVRHMLDVCRTEHLANYTDTRPMSIEDRAIICARAEGYGIALNNFESLARHERPKEPLVETFEPQEVSAE